MHYFTAYEMFLEKKILGHGLKSFRYLCDDDKYLQKIIKKNKKYEIVAKDDGYIQFRKEIGNNQSRIINIIYKNNTEEIYLNNYNRYWYQKEKDLYYQKKLIGIIRILTLFTKMKIIILVQNIISKK
jgi:hypothetical protein